MRRYLGLLGLCLSLLLASTASARTALYWLDATSSFDPYAGETAWIEEHVALIRGYGSFAYSHYCGKAKPYPQAIDYHDLATEGYAPLTPESRARYMTRVAEDKAAHCAGVSNDDVNLGMGYRDGTQNKSSYEPEAKEVAALIAQERAFWPEGIIDVNIQWHDLKARLEEHDPSAASIVESTSVVSKEFGVGPTSGINSESDYNALLAFDEGALHGGTSNLRPRKHLVFSGDYNNKNAATMEYNLATEILVSDEAKPYGGVEDGWDYVSTAGEYELPPTFWKGNEVELGTPWSGRFHPSGFPHVWMRYFTGGAVFVNPPGNSTVTVAGITLAGASGRVVSW